MSHQDQQQKQLHEELGEAGQFEGFGVEGDVAKGDEFVKDGKQAEHPWGVQYQGPFESATDGTARAVRLHARALEQAGVPVLLQSFSNSFMGPDGVVLSAQAMDPKIKEETHEMRHRSVRELRLRIKHMVIARADQLRAYIIPSSVATEPDAEKQMAIRSHLYKTTIVYSVWERTSIDDSIASILRRVGECWVPCQENKHLLERHGIERVVVVPHPWDPAGDMAKLTARASFSPMRRFYAIGLWQPRKQFHEMIGGFLLAFKPGDLARLTIKTRRTNFPNYPSPEESGKFWLADPRVQANGWTRDNAADYVRVHTDEWPEWKITRLHFNSNIYVCVSRGEAYCLPAFDAKVAGNRMVLVSYNGARDFAAESDVRVPFGMRPVPKEYGWEESALWAEARPEHIAEAMLKCEAPSSYVRPPLLGYSTMQAVGDLMKSRCEAVLRAATVAP